MRDHVADRRAHSTREAVPIETNIIVALEKAVVAWAKTGSSIPAIIA